MADHNHDLRPPDQSPTGEFDHEIDTGRIGKLSLALAILVILGFVFVIPVIRVLKSQHAQEQATPSPFAAQASEREPPKPHLQVNEPRDYEAFRHEEAAKLESYGWLDTQQTVAHIPVERAIDLVARHGLGVVATSSPAPSTGAP
jgi:hypothetical protein